MAKKNSRNTGAAAWRVDRLMGRAIRRAGRPAKRSALIPPGDVNGHIKKDEWR